MLFLKMAMENIPVEYGEQNDYILFNWASYNGVLLL